MQVTLSAEEAIIIKHLANKEVEHQISQCKNEPELERIRGYLYTLEQIIEKMEVI